MLVETITPVEVPTERDLRRRILEGAREILQDEDRVVRSASHWGEDHLGDECGSSAVLYACRYCFAGAVVVAAAQAGVPNPTSGAFLSGPIMKELADRIRATGRPGAELHHHYHPVNVMTQTLGIGGRQECIAVIDEVLGESEAM